jgi:hypothetical protein
MHRGSVQKDGSVLNQFPYSGLPITDQNNGQTLPAHGLNALKF